MASVAEIMSKARNLIRSKAPFYLPAILNFSFIDIGPDRPDGVSQHMTLVDGGIVLLNGEWFSSLGVPEAAAELVHTTHHFLRGYLDSNQVSPVGMGASLEQLEYFDAIVGISRCLAINSSLAKEGWAFRADALLPSKLGMPDHLLAGEYTKLILKSQPQIKQLAPEGGGGACPSCNKPPDGYKSRIDPKVPHRTPKQMRDAAKATLNQRRSSQSSGSGSNAHSNLWGELTEALEEKPTIVPWEQVLASAVYSAVSAFRAGHADFDYSRRSRRIFSNTFQPAMVGHNPNIAVSWDTSGSMLDKDTLSHVMTETKALMCKLGINEIRVIQSDTGVRSDQKVRPEELSAPTIRGLGGSHFSELFRYVDNSREPVNINIFFTDGEIGFDYAPRTPTVFVVVNSACRNPSMRWPMLEKHGRVVLVPVLDPPEEEEEEDT